MTSFIVTLKLYYEDPLFNFDKYFICFYVMYLFLYV